MITELTDEYVSNLSTQNKLLVIAAATRMPEDEILRRRDTCELMLRSKRSHLADLADWLQNPERLNAAMIAQAQNVDEDERRLEILTYFLGVKRNA